MQEVSCLEWRSIDTLHIPQHADAPQVLQADSTDAGGGVVLAGSPNLCILSWTFSSLKPAELQLTETHIDGVQSNCKLRVVFGAPLFPQACFHQTKGVVVMTADGALHSLTPLDQASPGGLLEDLAISSVNIRPELHKLGQSTSLGLITTGKAADHSICIGGQTGSLLVVPATCFDAGTTGGCYELHHAPSGYLGFFSKSVTPAVTWTCSLAPFASNILCALHADCSLRFWNPSTRQRLLVESLLQQSGQNGLMKPTAVGSVCSTRGHFRLVVHLEPLAGTLNQPQTVAVCMELQQSSDGQLQALNMRERMLEHSELRFNTLLTHTSTADTETAQTWLLSDAPSLHAITSNVSGQPHEESCRVRLIEKQGLESVSMSQGLQVRQSCGLTWYQP